jgi:hypothetical protein
MRRSGLNAPLAALALLLIAAGAFGVIVGLYGQLESCVGGNCARQSIASIGRETMVWTVAAGAALVLVGIAGLAYVIIRGRRRVPVDTLPVGPDGQLPVRVCPHCSTESRTAGEFCPICGAHFTRTGMSRIAKIAVVGGVGLLAFAGTAAGVIAYTGKIDDQITHRQNLATAYRAAQTREQARQDAEAQQQTEVAARQDLVRAAERSISRDMRKRSQEAYAIVDGPILGTQCNPVAGKDIADTTATSMDFDCLAYNKRVGTQLEGYNVSATLDFDTGQYTWQLGNN